MKNNLINRKNDSILNFFDDFFNRKWLRDELFDMKSNFLGNYSIEKINDDTYYININVAGYNKSEIDIEMDDDYLTIRGSKKNTQNDKYIYNSFSSNFENNFQIEKGAEILEANIDSGILKIKIKNKEKISSSKRKILIK